MKSEKVCLSKCKTILQSDGSVYNDEEISQIRDYLYMLAEIEHDVFLKSTSRKVNDDNHQLNASRLPKSNQQLIKNN
ncbi:MAG: hypothetical protein AB7O73_11275 [Bacteroidia bacterium]